MRRNSQPFYHRATLLFTTTTGCSEERFVAALRAFARSKAGRSIGLVAESVEVEPNEWMEPEAGDPSDL